MESYIRRWKITAPAKSQTFRETVIDSLYSWVQGSGRIWSSQKKGPDLHPHSSFSLETLQDQQE